MNFYTKYLFLLIFVFTFIGCQGESGPEDASQNQQQQSFQNPMQQPAPDIDVSDSELETFTSAIVSAQEVQMKSQQQLVDIVEEEGMDVPTFNKIAEAYQTGQSTDSLDVSEEDIKNFENASQRIQKAQVKVEQKVTAAIEDAGMELERFQEINNAVQQDSELQKRLREKIQKAQMQQ